MNAYMRSTLILSAFLLSASQLANAATKLMIENNCSTQQLSAAFEDQGQTYNDFTIAPDAINGHSASNGEHLLVAKNAGDLNTYSGNALQCQIVLDFNNGAYDESSGRVNVFSQTPGLHPGQYRIEHDGNYYKYILPISCDEVDTITTMTFTWSDIKGNSIQSLSATTDILATMLNEAYPEYEHVSTEITLDEDSNTHDLAITYSAATSRSN